MDSARLWEPVLRSAQKGVQARKAKLALPTMLQGRGGGEAASMTYILSVLAGVVVALFLLALTVPWIIFASEQIGYFFGHPTRLLTRYYDWCIEVQAPWRRE